jgi:hypothetical protein
MKNSPKVIPISELRHPGFYIVLDKLRNENLSEKERWTMLKTINKKTIDVKGVRVV